MKQKIDYKKVGLSIKKRRTVLDITQQELADQVELSVSHLSNIETNKTKVSLESLFNIASVLECTLDELIRKDHISDRALENSIFNDCDDFEREMIREVVKTLKETMKSKKVSSIEIKGKN